MPGPVLASPQPPALVVPPSKVTVAPARFHKPAPQPSPSAPVGLPISI